MRRVDRVVDDGLFVSRLVDAERLPATNTQALLRIEGNCYGRPGALLSGLLRSSDA